MLLRLAPVLFVLIWSTGWITARAAAPLGDPLAFLLARFVLAGILLGLVIAAFKVEFPRDPKIWLHGLISGVLLHTIYLGGVWVSIDQGLPTPVAGLVAALQPLLTAGLAVLLLSERLSPGQWMGIALGLCGLAVALGPDLVLVDGGALGDKAWLIGLNVIAITSVTLGSLYQKRFLALGDLRAISLLQYVGAALTMAPAALLFGSLTIEPSLVALGVMAWAVLGLSLAAIGLYLLLIRHGAVWRAASLIYLIPPLVALEALILFGEALSPISVIGMIIAVGGVYLVNRPTAKEQDESRTSD
ncbi:MAG: DMT family transporter [Pseudomonadota bacterium]